MNSPNRKRTRGRIGLTLAPDVHDILNEFGRCVYVPASVADGPLRCRNCGKELMDKAHDMRRPTRTEIIEAGVRLWLADKEAREMLKGYTPEQWAEVEEHARSLDRSTERINEEFEEHRREVREQISRGASALPDRINAPQTSLDAVGPTVESGRGKASVETIRPKPLPLERKQVVSIPKPGKRNKR